MFFPVAILAQAISTRSADRWLLLVRSAPKAMAQATASLRAAADTVRGALLTLHAAAGLAARSPCGEATRMLRAAEGLSRAALVCLVDASKPTFAPGAGATPRKRRSRPRGKKGKDKVEAGMGIAGAEVVDPSQVGG